MKHNPGRKSKTVQNDIGNVDVVNCMKHVLAS